MFKQLICKILIFMYLIISFTDCVTETRTVMMERVFDGDKRVCFTTEPVRKCKGRCRVIGPHQESRGFHCLPADEPSTRRLIVKCRTEPLFELSNKPVHWRDNVSTQAQCLPAN